MDISILERFQNIRLTKEEEDIIIITIANQGSVLEECENSLIGCFLSTKMPNLQAAKTTLRAACMLGDDIRIIKFQWVLDHGPGNFDNYLLLLRRWQLGLTATNTKFSKAEFWIQVWGVPFDLIAKEVSEAIGTKETMQASSVLGLNCLLRILFAVGDMSKALRGIGASLALDEPLPYGDWPWARLGNKVSQSPQHQSPRPRSPNRDLDHRSPATPDIPPKVTVISEDPSTATIPVEHANSACLETTPKTGTLTKAHVRHHSQVKHPSISNKSLVSDKEISWPMAPLTYLSNIPITVFEPTSQKGDPIREIRAKTKELRSWKRVGRGGPMEIHPMVKEEGNISGKCSSSVSKVIGGLGQFTKKQKKEDE
ncbi:hypothetical protein FCV25MIE_28849, partial [Fagus crenata]